MKICDLDVGFTNGIIISLFVKKIKKIYGKQKNKNYEYKAKVEIRENQIPEETKKEIKRT